MLQNDVVVVLLPWLLLLLSMDSFVVSLSLPYSILFMETTKSLQCSCIERLCLPFACFFPLLALWLVLIQVISWHKLVKEMISFLFALYLSLMGVSSLLSLTTMMMMILVFVVSGVCFAVVVIVVVYFCCFVCFNFSCWTLLQFIYSMWYFPVLRGCWLLFPWSSVVFVFVVLLLT